jgi:hypothetical protein
MPRPREVRTFIHLQRPELEFLRVLQRAVQKRAKRKHAPPLHEVIQGVILDYRRVIEIGVNPDLLTAFEQNKVRRRTSRTKPG